uniref:Wall-associated receptor kinase galacturonan-binding domain-containing protein n=1 Tax=Aegilops tauschii subsp. strangulata TaxID=200361 RepID=A0A453LN48_AEGTS
VPYPFGFGPDRCSAAPGFKLACVHGNSTGTSSGAGTRLFLGKDEVFEVKEISLENRKIRGVMPPIFSKAAINVSTATQKDTGFGDNHRQYTTPITTELVVTGCNVQVTLLFTASTGTYGYTTGCCSHCNRSGVLTADDVRNNYMVGYCTTPVFSYLASYTVQLKRLVGNSTINDDLPVYAFIAEESWFDSDRAVGLMNLGAKRSVSRSKANKDDHLLAPLVLEWACPNDGTCNASVSANTNCSTPFEGAQYVCHCNPGYKGNPYLTDGCQDIDECEQPKDHGCFGLVIGLSIAIGPSLILFFLGGLLIARKLASQG